MTALEFINANGATVRKAMVTMKVTGIDGRTSLQKILSAYANMSEDDQTELLGLIGFDESAVDVEDDVKAPIISGVEYLNNTSAPSKRYPQGKPMKYSNLPIVRFTNTKNPVVQAGALEITVVLGTQFSLFAEKNPLQIGQLIAVKMQSDMNNGNENGLHTKNIGGNVVTLSQLCVGAMPDFQTFITELEEYNASKPTLKTEIARLQANSLYKMSYDTAKAQLLEDERQALAEYRKKRAEARVFKY